VRRRVPAGLVPSAGAAVAALLAGCSSSAGSTHQTSTPRSGGPQATASTNSPGTEPGGTVPTGPVATAAPGSLAGIAVAVLSLARTSGDTVTAQIKVTNNRTASFDIGSSFIDPAIANPNTTNDAAGITLTDTPNAKKYLVLLDSNQDCICSKQLINADLDAGTSGVIFAESAAPPASTRSLQVTIPRFPPIENVAISDASPATPSRAPDGAAGTAAPADEAGLVLTLSRRVVDLNGTKERPDDHCGQQGGHQPGERRAVRLRQGPAVPGSAADAQARRRPVEQGPGRHRPGQRLHRRQG